MKTIEIWKDIKGYEGLYQISSGGRIRSLDRITNANGGSYKLKGRLLKPVLTMKGYLRVTLYKNQKGKNAPIHRLVANAFIPKIEGKATINHIDGIKTNNKAVNLEWCTQSENVQHSYEIGISKSTGDKIRGELNHGSKLSDERVRFIRKNSQKNGGTLTNVEMAKMFEVTHAAVNAVVNQRTWKHVK